MEGHKVSDKDTARPWWLRVWGDEGRMARRENRAMEAATEEERRGAVQSRGETGYAEQKSKSLEDNQSPVPH